MTEFASLTGDLKNSSLAPFSSDGRSLGLLGLTEIVLVLKEQTIILKRINSKLWKLNDMMSRETQSEADEFKVNDEPSGGL